jgi:hypothetical protein
MVVIFSDTQLKDTIWNAVEEPVIESIIPTIVEDFKDINKKRQMISLKDAAAKAEEKCSLLLAPILRFMNHSPSSKENSTF